MAEHFLSGYWVGFYENRAAYRTAEPDPNEHRFRIEARLDVIENRMTGRMFDIEPFFEVPYERVLALSRSRMSSDQVEASESYLQNHPGVLFRTELPTESILVGQVKGDEIAFKKLYQGFSRSSWVYQGQEIGARARPGHEVSYSGTLTKNGTAIEGTWRIHSKGLLGRKGVLEGEGTFYLAKRLD